MSLKYPLQNTPNLDECQITTGSGIIACRDSAKSFDVMEEHFDQVTLLVRFFVVTALRIAVPGRRDNEFDAAIAEVIDNPCSVIATISQACGSGAKINQIFCNSGFMLLAWREFYL